MMQFLAAGCTDQDQEKVKLTGVENWPKAAVLVNLGADGDTIHRGIDADVTEVHPVPDSPRILTEWPA